MKRYEPLYEKRRNPEKNPFVGAWDYVEMYKDDPDVYISFTRIDKIGINPQSKYNTPVGIYTYPLKEFSEEYITSTEESEYRIKRSLGSYAPFAGEAKYVNFIRVKDKSNFVENMYTDYGSNDYDRDMKILEKKYKKIIYDIILNSPAGRIYKTWDIDSIWKEVFLDKALKTAYEKNPIMSMWNITRLIAKNITTNKLNYKKPDDMIVGISDDKKSSTKWNLILSKDLGYSGFADKSGKGYIHSAEPMQAVFLRKSAFEVLHRVENKPAKLKINPKFKIGDKFKALKKLFIPMADEGAILIITEFEVGDDGFFYKFKVVESNGDISYGARLSEEGLTNRIKNGNIIQI